MEVADTDTVDAGQTRLAEAGFASIDERWETYTVLAESGTAGGPSEGSPCGCGTADK